MKQEMGLSYDVRFVSYAMEYPPQCRLLNAEILPCTRFSIFGHQPIHMSCAFPFDTAVYDLRDNSQ